MDFRDWMKDNKPVWHECYFGGAFNPIHFGHIEAALEAQNTLRKPVVLLPSGNPPHKQDLIPFAHRYKMCELVAQHYNLKVSKAEQGTTPTPTINTLRNLVPEFEKFLVPFLVGTDSIENLHTWIEPDALSKNVLWVVAPRGNAPIENPKLKLNIIKLKSPPMDVSATMIRQLVQKQDYTALKRYLPDFVLNYIIQQRLYQ